MKFELMSSCKSSITFHYCSKRHLHISPLFILRFVHHPLIRYFLLFPFIYIILLNSFYVLEICNFTKTSSTWWQVFAVKTEISKQGKSIRIGVEMDHIRKTTKTIYHTGFRLSLTKIWDQVCRHHNIGNYKFTF